ncbi:MAG TPA: MerR family transcriptional regulator [Rhizobiales bacterium]|nr:MerR family transcriptional regulator [Hyphomicrobiales bacterium]
MDKAPEAFRTISEVADELEVPKHVLRFWEAKFAQLKPMKRGGGRRYYRPEDVALLRGIRFLLYNDGYTIRGVQKILREHGPRFVMDSRRMAEEDEQEGAMSQPHEIPDIAAEAAQSGVATIVREPTERGLPKINPEAIGALLDELEACYLVLVAAKG